MNTKVTGCKDCPLRYIDAEFLNIFNQLKDVEIFFHAILPHFLLTSHLHRPRDGERRYIWSRARDVLVK